jgi:metal-responsive CopG/Arc/MetJ family transcriptional regulator
MDRTSAAKSIHLTIQQPLFDQIDNFRRVQAGIPSRPQAIRDLVEEALAARQDEEAGDARWEIAAT